MAACLPARNDFHTAVFFNHALTLAACLALRRPTHVCRQRTEVDSPISAPRCVPDQEASGAQAPGRLQPGYPNHTYQLSAVFRCSSPPAFLLVRCPSLPELLLVRPSSTRSGSLRVRLRFEWCLFPICSTARRITLNPVADHQRDSRCFSRSRLSERLDHRPPRHR